MAHHWRSPITPLHQKLSYFLDKGKYCDVKIQVQDETFDCHRVVLASSSKYFDAMFGGRFKESSSEVSLITLQDIDAVTFKTIVEVIYSGCELSVDIANFQEFLKMGQFLGMSSIVKKCESFILDNLWKLSDNIFKIFNLACSTSAYLKSILANYILQGFHTFVKQDAFLQISYNELNILLREYRQSSSFSFKNEDFFLDALIRWVYYSREKRDVYIQEFVGMVDFSKVSTEYGNFLLKEYRINCEVAEEYADGQIVKYVRMKPTDQQEECIDDNQVHKLIPFEDLQYLEISTTIHLLALDSYKEKGLFRYNIISLNNKTVEHKWFISRQFSKYSRINALAASGDYVYCFDTRKLQGGKLFFAYSSVDFSLEPSQTLASIPLDDGLYQTKICGFNNDHIYFLNGFRVCPNVIPEGFSREEFSRCFHCYKCDINKWFPVPQRTRQLACSTLTTDNTLIYLIGGLCYYPVDENYNAEKFAQAYDPRSPTWITLPNTTYSHQMSSSSCAINGNIYISNGTHIEAFDRTAGRWETISTKEGDKKIYSCVASYKNKLYAFNLKQEATFCIYNPSWKMWSPVAPMNGMIFPHSCTGRIVFKSLE